MQLIGLSVVFGFLVRCCEARLLVISFFYYDGLVDYVMYLIVFILIFLGYNVSVLWALCFFGVVFCAFSSDELVFPLFSVFCGILDCEV